MMFGPNQYSEIAFMGMKWVFVAIAVLIVGAFALGVWVF